MFDSVFAYVVYISGRIFDCYLANLIKNPAHRGRSGFL